MRESQFRFIRQQGFAAPPSDNHLYSALMFQPRIIGALVVLGIVYQSSWLFLVLSAVLLWNALVPTHNLFDAIYNHVVADPRGLPRLSAAPAPRRFAQAVAGTLAVAIWRSPHAGGYNCGSDCRRPVRRRADGLDIRKFLRRLVRVPGSAAAAAHEAPVVSFLKEPSS